MVPVSEGQSQRQQEQQQQQQHVVHPPSDLPPAQVCWLHRFLISSLFLVTYRYVVPVIVQGSFAGQHKCCCAGAGINRLQQIYL